MNDDHPQIRTYDWDARPVRRNHTVLGIRKLKGVRKLTQTTANTSEEASAAADGGIDLIMGNAHNTSAVRQGAPGMFFTAALALPNFPTPDDVLRAAFATMKDGADSIYTARGPHVVEMLAREEIPVMCHLGLVPRRSTWKGGLRAIGTTPEEARQLWTDFRDMENAGAFSVEAEVIASQVMRAITRATSLITSSLGSGPDGDIIYLFQNDICGEQPHSPRHARAFGNLHEARRSALRSYRDAVNHGDYPAQSELVCVDTAIIDDLEAFITRTAHH